ncbi:unnamed protein product [Ectocarpus sp. CCAP 1310/34]|nr:unnamed protein product [Ectocarpus sp. CCAP 1310/34]
MFKMSTTKREVTACQGRAEPFLGHNLSLNPNPWAEPPESIVAKGPKSIRRYFEDLYAEHCRIGRRSVKLVLVGQEGAGKMSLRRSMKANKATPTGEWKEESTVFADVETMELEGSSVRVYDCAGQVAYTGLLQMFLTPRSVCVLVCNAGEFEQRLRSDNIDQVEEDCRKLEGLRVCDWLRSISRRVPGNDVILVATKCDLVSGNVEETGRRMEHACQTWLSSWVRDGMDAVRLERHVSLTSCFPIVVGEHGESSPGNHASKQGWACDWRRGRSWDFALTFLDSIEHGRDSVEMVMLKSPDSDSGAKATAVGKTTMYQGITVEELSAKWQGTVDDLGRRGIMFTNAKNALEGALSIREFDGSLVCHEKFVFLEVVWLARILKPLLNHKDQGAFDGRVKLGDTGDTRITRRSFRHDFVGQAQERGRLIFPLENDPAEGLVVLLRLKPHRPESVGKVIDTFCSGLTPAFRASWKIFLRVPPGAAERTFAVVVEYSSIDNELVAQVFGGISTPGPWTAMSYVMSAVSLMLVDFPGLRWKGSLKCPQHGDGMLFVNKVSPPHAYRLWTNECPSSLHF